MSVTYYSEQDRGELQATEDGAIQVIQFQHGPVDANGVNGVQNEQVIELLLMRLRALNHKLPCRENSLAITKLDEAQMWLARRTAIRIAQGVEGKNAAHVS